MRCLYFIRRTIVCLLTVITCVSGALAQSLDAPVITILHTNDTHSQFDAYDNGKGQPRGGVVERASLLEYFRQQDPDLLYLDAGDMIQGSPYFNIFGGELEMICMNQQRLIASTFGNHEFDNGLEELRKMLSKADFPLISANVHCEGTPVEHQVLPHLITESHGVKIGITGVTCPLEGLVFARNWQGITYEDPIAAVNREADVLRHEGCDLVIVLSHLGYTPWNKSKRSSVEDDSLVAAIHGVDIVIGAHTHVNIERGVWFDDSEGHPAIVTQTGGKGNPIGYLQVTMKRGSKYEGCQYSVDSIVCKKLHPEDYDLAGYGNDMRELLAPYTEALQAQMNVVLGYAPERMDKGRPQGLLGNFTADALRHIGQKLWGRTIDFSVMNNGGLRNVLPAGDVTVGTLYSIYPFENTVALIELQGKELKSLIQSLAGRGMESISGATVQLVMNGDRSEAADVRIQGKEIDDDHVYNIATIDYLAEGNSGMTALTRCVSSHDTGIRLRDAMIDYVKELTAEGKTVSSALDDRVTGPKEQ